MVAPATPGRIESDTAVPIRATTKGRVAEVSRRDSRGGSCRLIEDTLVRDPIRIRSQHAHQRPWNLGSLFSTHAEMASGVSLVPKLTVCAVPSSSSASSRVTFIALFKRRLV